MRRSSRVASAAAAAAAASTGARGVKRDMHSTLVTQQTAEKRTKTNRSPTKYQHVAVKEEALLLHTEKSSRLNIKRKARVTSEDAAAALIKSERGGHPAADAHAALIKREPGGGDDSWRRLCSTQQLSCRLTLASGQVFSWKFHALSCEWSGVVGDNVFALRERDQAVEFKCLHPAEFPAERAHEILSHYFRLEIDAAPLYALWTAEDDKMAQLIRSLPGHRLVRQDPVECLFAFICSSNNNIQRIQQMVDKLRAAYGTLLCTHAVDATDGSTAQQQQSYYAFPSTETLADRCEEATLRALGFGYRAPFITKSSKLLLELGGASYLDKLRDSKVSDNDDDYQEKLMAFTGVGRKVADCVALFSLERLDAIPVDTHVWQIACREFDPTLADKKSITPSVYKVVGDHFRGRFAPFAGWAHSVLFTGDLTSFQSLLPTAMQKTATPTKKQKKTTASTKTTAVVVVASGKAAVKSGGEKVNAKPVAAVRVETKTIKVAKVGRNARSNASTSAPDYVTAIKSD